MSESTSETLTIKASLTISAEEANDGHKHDFEKEILIEVEVTNTTYNSSEYYNESGGRDVTITEVTSWELGHDEDLSDLEFKEYEKLEVSDIQDLVNKVE